MISTYSNCIKFSSHQRGNIGLWIIRDHALWSIGSEEAFYITSWPVTSSGTGAPSVTKNIYSIRIMHAGNRFILNIEQCISFRSL